MTRRSRRLFRSTKVNQVGSSFAEVLSEPPGIEAPPLDPIAEDEPLECCGNPQDVAEVSVVAKSAWPDGMPLPPGLPPPPGLETRRVVEELPEALCAKPKFFVRIKGLPKALLTACMMETIWQQAGLGDDVVSVVEERPERPEDAVPWAQVLVGFASSRVAVRCAAHFHSCQWDQSGMEVTTEAFEAGSEDCALTGLSAQELLALPQGWSLPLGGDFELYVHEQLSPSEEVLKQDLWLDEAARLMCRNGASQVQVKLPSQESSMVSKRYAPEFQGMPAQLPGIGQGPLTQMSRRVRI